MPPEQSHPAGPQFDFIMSANQKPKRKLFNVSSRAGKLLMLVGIGAVLVIIMGIVISTLFGKGAVRTNELKALAETQTEIVRVAELGKSKTRDKTALGYVMAVKLSVTSGLNQTSTFLKDNGDAVAPKDLNGAKDTTTDATLKSAEQDNSYDTAIVKVLKDELAAYQAAIKTEFDAAGNTKEKELLKDLYTQASLLLQ